MKKINKNVIYGLFDPTTKELRYVGYSNSLNRRISEHYEPARLKKKTHKNDWLKTLLARNQKAEVDILEIYETEEELPQAEIECIAYYKFIGCDLTNGTIGGEGCQGKIVSEETKQKLREINLGRKVSEETRQKLSKANSGINNPFYGKQHSENTKQKLSAAKSGENHPQFGKTGEKSHMFGTHPSDETRKKLSQLQSGEGNGMYGKTHTKEAKKKIAEARIGIPLSAETKHKMSEAQKGSQNGAAKLTEADIPAIRNDNRSISDIAKHYGVGKTAISYIKNGKSWGHIK